MMPEQKEHVMAPATVGHAPNLEQFLKSLKTQSLEGAIARVTEFAHLIPDVHAAPPD